MIRALPAPFPRPQARDVGGVQVPERYADLFEALATVEPERLGRWLRPSRVSPGSGS